MQIEFTGVSEPGFVGEVCQQVGTRIDGVAGGCIEDCFVADDESDPGPIRIEDSKFCTCTESPCAYRSAGQLMK